MKKVIVFALGLSLILNACLPAFLKPASPTPAPKVDLQATAAVAVQQTRNALPTPTIAPSDTPVIAKQSATNTQKPATPTETQNSILLTLSATLGTGTVFATPATLTVSAAGTLTTPTPSIMPNPFVSATPTETLHPQHYGTMPPNLPFGRITLINKSKTEAYISLQCTTNDGYVTIIEYPVDRTIEFKAPAGKFVYVAWVGGRQMTGKFGLGTADELTIKLYKDRIEIK
jgi:hypothetical protein